MTSDLPRRLEAHWKSSGLPGEGARVAVAFSGGLDSLVLLHLLRFSTPGLDLTVEAAHFDHRMRRSSADDAAWARGVATAWNVPFHMGSAADPPTDSASARSARYRFLEDFAERGARCVLTAHHADDQVETVLFRILRGTGLEGLRGIPPRRGDLVARPLLPFSRTELEAYARHHRIRPRDDPSNRSMRFARSRVRHRLLPALEEARPGAREGILRLARNADRAVEALRHLLEPVLEAVILERDSDRVILAREGLCSLPAAVRAEVVRTAASWLGFRLSESGTADAEQFITTVRSGTRSTLVRDLRVRREFDRILLERSGPEGGGGTDPGFDDDSELRELVITAPEAGEGTVLMAGARRRVRWAPGPPPIQGHFGGWRCAGFNPDALDFPLVVRGWRRGDRMRTEGGTKKLKKLFVELREPRERRHRIPLLADARGRIVWIPGRRVAAGVSGGGESRWHVGVDDADQR